MNDDRNLLHLVYIDLKGLLHPFSYTVYRSINVEVGILFQALSYDIFITLCYMLIDLFDYLLNGKISAILIVLSFIAIYLI